MLASVDAQQAIADLTEISPQVRDVVVIGADGAPAGSNLADEAAQVRLADGAKRLVDAAEAMRPGVSQLEAATLAGSVFVVRDGDRMIAATTTPEPTVGLVFYDLKTCLRSVDVGSTESTKAKAAASPAPEAETPPPKPKPARRRAPAKKTDEEGAEDAAS
jgi:predicted regulator of Ras-like GTPase activity (Roadblock/LC7/MglB family)